MNTAVELTPNNRFILRSAARFFVHINDPDRALHLLCFRSRATPSDPWLIASEIAVEAILDRTSDLVKVGRRMLAADAYHPLHLSELASAIGTWKWKLTAVARLESFSERRLFSQQKMSVAQAGWAFAKWVYLNLITSYMEKRSFVSHVQSSFHGGRWNDALNASRQWLGDQPFSSRPAVLGSYVAGVWSQDFVESVQLPASDSELTQAMLCSSITSLSA